MAVGPDGLLLINLFYQKYKHIIGSDVTKLVFTVC